MNTSHPSDKNNTLTGKGYKIKTNRKDGEVESITAKRVFGLKPIITSSGLASSSTNVIISTPVLWQFKHKNTQTEYSNINKPWCNVHYNNHPNCMTDKEMIEQDQTTSGIICPTCNSTICPRGQVNMCYQSK